MEWCKGRYVEERKAYVQPPRGTVTLNLAYLQGTSFQLASHRDAPPLALEDVADGHPEGLAYCPL